METHPLVAEMLDECIRIRRRLHRIPELAYEEFQTQEFVMSELAKCSPDSLDKITGTGVKAVWYAENPGMTIAIRADMDGIRGVELSGADYASENANVMHGCGHDGHMTMVLLLARLVARSKSELKHNVVLLFQPAEEGGGGGGWRMIKNGALKNPDVDRIYGLHVWPSMPRSKLGVRWGPLMAQSSSFDVTIHGKSAHGASPQLGVDAVVVAAQLITMLQTAITRSLDPHQDALLTVGKINGGTARNTIADRVDMSATLRIMSDGVYELLMRRIQDMTDGLALATGARFEINPIMRYPCVDNPRWMVEDFYKLIDMSDVVLVEPVMAAEDFACYQREVPGLFMFLGLGEDCVHPLHSEHFNFDEQVLLTGVEAYRRILGLL